MNILGETVLSFPIFSDEVTAVLEVMTMMMMRVMAITVPESSALHSRVIRGTIAICLRVINIQN